MITSRSVKGQNGSLHKFPGRGKDVKDNKT